MMVRRAQAISLTPLIDVVFILLMFFMLTSSFVKEKQLTLASATSNASAESKKPQRLWLGADGDLSDQQGSPIDNAIITSRYQQLPIILHPAEDANVQTIVNCLTALKQLGLNNITLSAPYRDNGSHNISQPGH